VTIVPFFSVGVITFHRVSFHQESEITGRGSTEGSYRQYQMENALSKSRTTWRMKWSGSPWPSKTC